MKKYKNSTARALPALSKRATHPNDTRAGQQHYRGPLTAERPKREPLGSWSAQPGAFGGVALCVCVGGGVEWGREGGLESGREVLEGEVGGGPLFFCLPYRSTQLCTSN